ncbi:MAG: gluconate 2-dehydrogenase subunit 3 family protein [Gemmatimonadota bacterium]
MPFELDWSRRQFVLTSGGGLGALWALGMAGCRDLAEEASRAAARGEAFRTLSADDGRQLDEIAALILPSDDGPGAREAGAVYFLDRVLGDPALEGGNLEFVQASLGSLGDRVRAAGAASGFLGDLPLDQRVEVLRTVEREDPGFFGYARLLVLAGTLSHPDYGGNRDHLGWALMGMEHADTYEPPYGFYDAEARQAGETP